MKVTFLGHQCWLFQSQDGRKILLDPIVSKMGNGITKICVWPNRKLDLAAIGKIHCLIISHEHADHFNIESLLQIRKANQPDCVYIPEISTRALKNALRQIGFCVREMTAFSDIDIGTINLIPLPSIKSRYEPDVFSLLIKDSASKGSFYTPIDSIPSELTIEYLRSEIPIRTIDNFTNNFVQRISTFHQVPNSEYDNNLKFVQKTFHNFCAQFNPSNVLISGQGWSYTGELKKNNNVMFTVDHKRLIDSINRDEFKLNALLAAELDRTYVLEGTTFTSQPARYTIRLELDDRSFRFEDLDHMKIKAFSQIDETLEMITAVRAYILNQFGIELALGAHKLNLALFKKITVPDDELNGLFVQISTDRGPMQFEYKYSDSAFYEITDLVSIEIAKAHYAFGLVAFCSDFYQIINGWEEAHLVSENSMITWNNRFDLLNEPTDVDIMNCFRPQYRPLVFERYYFDAINRLEKLHEN